MNRADRVSLFIFYRVHKFAQLFLGNNHIDQEKAVAKELLPEKKTGPPTLTSKLWADFLKFYLPSNSRPLVLDFHPSDPTLLLATVRRGGIYCAISERFKGTQ